MSAIAPYRDAAVPASDRCFKLELKPSDWKVRMWRAFDNSVTPMVRLDAELRPQDIENHDLRDLLTPFAVGLHRVPIYLERGAAAPLPLAWSMGRLTIEREHPCVFLHRVLDDPVGMLLSGLFRAGEARADVTLSLSPYEIGRDRIEFAVRDYDIGAGADFSR